MTCFSRVREKAYEEEERRVIRTIRPAEHGHHLFKDASKLPGCKQFHNDTLLLQKSLSTAQTLCFCRVYP